MIEKVYKVSGEVFVNGEDVDYVATIGDYDEVEWELPDLPPDMLDDWIEECEDKVDDACLEDAYKQVKEAGYEV